MKRCCALLLVLVSTTYESDAVNIVGKGSASSFSQAGLFAHPTPKQRHLNPIVVRPNAGNGPEKVKFGLRAMNFFGADLKHHNFNLDMVMSIRWTDSRVIDLIPEGLDKLSMGREQAEKNMWMPGINVTNRDIEKYEIISASVTIYRSGEVRRVERANTRVMKKFMLKDYPFDTQDLAVNIASSKYMVDEVLLVPDQDAAGVYEDIWGLYGLKHWRQSAIIKRDGPLEKSRGILDITVKRNLDKYSQDHLVPTAIVLMISWAVFYFPFCNPFITARLCLSILALLQFTNLIVKSTKELPGPAPFNWNDLLNQQIQTLMFVTITLNISSEIAMHSFQNEGMARSLNNDCKILVPFTSAVTLILILGGGSGHWISLELATNLTQGGLFALLVLYAGYAYKGEKRRQAEEKALEALEALEAADPEKLDTPKISARLAERRAQLANQCAVGGVAAMGAGQDDGGEDGGDAGDC